MTTEKRKFHLDPNAIALLIQSQAGSLQKAILEAITNALDAGSSCVNITLTSDRVVIEDDGRGFKDKHELGQFFERFGFDHAQHDRTVGRFGVGRGQLFNFGRNLWTTNTFTMHVDAREDLFGYDLGVADVPHQGVRIEIDLYEPLNFTNLSHVENDLKKLAKFSPLTVLVNGKQINKDPATQTWDHETDDAWVKFDDSYALKVYSQGLYVQDLPTYKYGKGGLVVTKVGHPLKQNLARNDTLITECPVWRRIEKELAGLSRSLKDDSSTKRTMNESMRATLALEAINGEDIDAVNTLLTAPIFTTTNNRHVRLEALLASGYLSTADNQDPAADLLMQRKQAMIVSPRTLSRFGVESVSELSEKLTEAFTRYAALLNNPKSGMRLDYAQTQQFNTLSQRLAECVIEECVDDLPMRANIDLIEVKNSETTKDERLALSLIRRTILPKLTYLVNSYLHPDQDDSIWNYNTQNTRAVQLAVVDSVFACTDGLTKIWISREYLNGCIKNGAAGFVGLSNILVHELLHDFDTSIGHNHDHDFYQAYHDITSGPEVSDAGFYGYRTWVARGGKASAYAIKELERAQMLTTDDVNSRTFALANPKVDQAEQIPEPKRRRAKP